MLASHFAPAQLQTAISIYRNNFKPSFQLSEPYVIACMLLQLKLIPRQIDWQHHSKTILGIIKGNRQQLQPPVASDSEFWDQEAALQQMIAYSFIGGPNKKKS
jgi:hypothetical protein